MPSKLLQLFSKLPCFRNEERDDIESSYYKNLSKLLEGLIASCSESYPIQCYSADELMRATNNFHPSSIVKRNSNYNMFRGFLKDRSVTIVKHNGNMHPNEDADRSYFIRDIVVSIQMSNHENVLKLLGCCLEFPIPAMVLEYAEKGVLNQDGSLRGANEAQVLPWKTRLRIAKQLASAVTHLHNAFPTPIIHRDLKPQCIFLDNDYVPKLSNFSLSITIPPMQSDVEDAVRGTLGYLDPDYVMSGTISERSDVYSFGVLLLVFLTGKSVFLGIESQGDYSSVVEYAKSQQFRTIVDPKILDEVGGNEQVEQQLQDFLSLALLCTQRETERRPYMMYVANELFRIDESVFPTNLYRTDIGSQYN